MTNSTALEGQRVTGDGKYTDKFDFNFSESGIETQSCTVEACSESQVNSVVDYSTNYCNLNNLYCSSKDGCAPINYDLDYKETYVACSQHDDVCKVTGLVVPPACSADIEKAVLAITQAGIDIADAVDDCADGFTDACNKDINSVLSDLTAATVDITAAVYDCGGTEPTQCSADIDAIIADLDTATIAITNAVIDCAVDPTKCTADIMKASQSIVQAGKDIAAATVDCA